jgi:hypothetical protein
MLVMVILPKSKRTTVLSYAIIIESAKVAGQANACTKKNFSQWGQITTKIVMRRENFSGYDVG